MIGSNRGRRKPSVVSSVASVAVKFISGMRNLVGIFGGGETGMAKGFESGDRVVGGFLPKVGVVDLGVTCVVAVTGLEIGVVDLGMTGVVGVTWLEIVGVADRSLPVAANIVVGFRRPLVQIVGGFRTERSCGSQPGEVQGVGKWAFPPSAKKIIMTR